MICKKYRKDMDMATYINNYVDFPLTREACRACSDYGKVWSCPPFSFCPSTILTAFDSISIRLCQLWIEEKDQRLPLEDLFVQARTSLFQEIRAEEEERPGSLALLAGSCHLCDPLPCARAEEKPCRRPSAMRHSMESMGAKVGPLIEDLFGIPLLWAKDGTYPPYFCLLAALCYGAKTPR